MRVHPEPISGGATAGIGRRRGKHPPKSDKPGDYGNGTRSIHVWNNVYNLSEYMMNPLVKTLLLASSACLYLVSLRVVAAPIAPTAPWSPQADKMVAMWSKLSHQHMTKEGSLKTSCSFPSAATVGVKAYPGSLAINWARGGGAVSDSEDVPMIELVSKDPLSNIIAWYQRHYPHLKAKRVFETAGPGINYLTVDKVQYQHHPADVDVTFQSGRYGGCGGLLEAPAAYRTSVRIYYRPHDK